jgi:hypothetical protein
VLLQVGVVEIEGVSDVAKQLYPFD